MIRKFFTYISLFLASVMMLACSPIDDGTNGNNGNNNEDPEMPAEERNLYAYLCQIAEDNREARTNGDEIKRVYIVAHRGNTKAGKIAGAPDNSIPAIEYAIKYGADMVELDVRTTSDGHFVAVHDATIQATTGKNLEVSNITLAELKTYPMITGNGKKFKAANGNYVYTPTLQEALAACKGKIFVNLDLKQENPAINERKLVNAILEVEMGNEVMIYTSGYSTARKYIETAMAEGVNNLCIHPHIGQSNAVKQYESLPSVKLFQYSYGLWVSGTNIPRDLHKDDLLTYSNILTYDQELLQGNYSKLDIFLSSDTDFIQTDYCEVVHEYLKSKGLR